MQKMKKEREQLEKQKESNAKHDKDIEEIKQKYEQVLDDKQLEMKAYLK